MLEGTISLLYKKGDRADPRNYRPITLLNGDYKLLMRVLASRMNEAVVQFVSDDLQDQSYIEKEDEEALLLFADMEKAFDRCSWDFLKEGLDALGLGGGVDTLLGYVNLAYNESNPPTRKMAVNGYLSDGFPLGSGVAQGCPLSPLLFLVIAEPLTRLINNNKEIERHAQNPPRPRERAPQASRRQKGALCDMLC
jgi:hypothetical protein